ncbi:MAG TPA: FecR domain-containing protein [Candidatus Saccharimonadales bacterium]|nr:FecR domain-containing protein [Candidatus Saccharimonadales bacterium]
MPSDPKQPQTAPKIRRVEVYWTAVTYKTVAIYVLLIAAVILGGVYFMAPSWYAVAMKKITSAVTPVENEGLRPDQKQAKFVNLDGKVQVKKVNSVQWVDADYRTSLDKGDLVQTGSDGAARITFADETTYTIKPDTLVTVEENNTDSNKPTSVAMRINTGAVDLATPNWAQADSKAAVTVEDATAQLRPNSRAAVKADPQSKENEIVVSSGSAEVKRGQERVELTQYQKVNIPSGGPFQKSDVLAPPELAQPLNLAPIIAENTKTTSIRFEWKPVANAISYTLRISATAMFTKTVKEARVSGTSAEISGLDAGDFFWNVVATDVKKQNSEVSETFKFTLVSQGRAQEMMLEIDSPQIHGRVAEIIGRTEPGAALIINGQPVPNISPDGSFRHFTEPLEPGQHTIVVIGQNRRGGTAKQQISIVIPK